MDKVRAGGLYRFEATGLDRFDPKTDDDVKDGDIVKVVNLMGCPPCNTMGHCHINKNGKFAGLVLTMSLKKIEK